MAHLVDCPVCNKAISSDASDCPHCGDPQHKYFKSPRFVCTGYNNDNSPKGYFPNREDTRNIHRD